MYKYALTGHTCGLGKEIINMLPYDTLCFSRSNGYDISKSNTRKRIIEECIDCDVFINNAYDKFSQVDLLYDLAETWKDTERHIINIGSNITNYQSKFLNVKRLKQKSYKTALLNAVNEINKCNIRLKVIYFNIVGYLDTQEMKNKYQNNVNFISTQKVANDIIKTTYSSCSN
tara:strand:+ start:3227 stop:3745 length:519 start_codon:yes stop_codon:yes gene_type:complete